LAQNEIAEARAMAAKDDARAADPFHVFSID